MNYIKSYKIFESKDYTIPVELRDDIRDMALELSDDGLEVSCFWLKGSHNSQHPSERPPRMIDIYQRLRDPNNRNPYAIRNYPGLIIYSIENSISNTQLFSIHEYWERLRDFLEPHGFIVDDIKAYNTNALLIEIIKL